MTVAVVVRMIEAMRMIAIGMIVIVIVMVMRMAVRPPSVAVIVHVLVRRDVSLARAGLAFFEDHFGLTASANAAHQAISISRTFNSSQQAIRAEAPTSARGEAGLASRPII